MTVLSPCRRCHRRADCQIKKDTQAKLRGIGLTKANLRCKIPEQDFPPGARVRVEAFKIVEGDFSSEDYGKATVFRTGVVRTWSSGRALVVLDKDQEIQKLTDPADKIGLLYCEPDRLTRIGDAVVLLCDCGIDAFRCVHGDLPSTRSGKWACPLNEIPKEFW